MPNQPKLFTKENLKRFASTPWGQVIIAILIVVTIWFIVHLITGTPIEPSAPPPP